jgi:hypothetical protein
MARTSATVLLEISNEITKRIDKIIASDGVWAVYYQHKPINLKTESTIAFVAPRYKSVSFSNKGHAINLARKLNKQFDTTDFTVIVLTHAEIIYSE